MKCRYFIFGGRFLFKEGVVLLNNEMDLYFILKKGIIFVSDMDLPLALPATVNCHDVTSSFKRFCSAVTMVTHKLSVSIVCSI